MTSLGHDVRHGGRIARIELRRSLRKSFGTRKRQLTALGFVLLFSPTLLFWFRAASDAGRVAAEQGTMALDTLGIQVTLLVVAFALMGALRVVQQGRPDGDALLLTATSTRAVLIGTTIHATVQLVLFVMIPTLLFAAGFALGAEMPTIVLTTTIAAIPLFTAVTILGTVGGQLVVLGLLKSHLFRSVSRVFGLVLLVVLLALGYAAMAPLLGVTEPFALLSPVAQPAIEYLAFAFVGTPLSPGLDGGSFVVGAAVVLSIPVLFVVANRLAPALWFADATPTKLIQRDVSTSRADATTSVEGGQTDSGRPFPSRYGPRPVVIALGLWTRWVRIPVRFSTLFPLTIILAMAVIGSIGDPESLPLALGAALVFAAVYVSGGVFGLNPLGEAGEMRTVESLSATRPRTLVFGHAIAGLFVGTPLAVVGTLLLTIAAGTPAPLVVILVALAVVSTVAGAGVALGIGTVLPSEDAQRTYRGYDVATPSQWALVGYMFATTLLVGIAALGSIFVFLPAEGGSLSLLRVGAPVVAAVVLVLVGAFGYRTATRRFVSPVYPDT
ncbi:hypothetical protein GJR96_13230 [Haloferax sp. MBLA0076]|uniref:ABC-2 type transport system permease protein n=1 Tax=Haloferax litoreum TaxID=2666140 RepID=A0A6A8GMG9_9EURY|nr:MULTISPECIES: hypothetical protein [Haloferax]KAB1194348.1 hypothetical protein Hfx1148_13170 [Haloferax sp. CBA1148]MRX22910.1 hypothetical protein [Haloferax litoreum]